MQVCIIVPRFSGQELWSSFFPLPQQPFSKIWEGEIAQKYTTIMFSCSSASIFFSVFICLTSWWVSNWDFRHWYILVLWTGALLWSGLIMPPVIQPGGQTLIPSDMHAFFPVIRIPFSSPKQLLSTPTAVIYSILILGCKMRKGDCTRLLEKTCTCSMHFFLLHCWLLVASMYFLEARCSSYRMILLDAHLLYLSVEDTIRTVFLTLVLVIRAILV